MYFFKVSGLKRCVTEKSVYRKYIQVVFSGLAMLYLRFTFYLIMFFPFAFIACSPPPQVGYKTELLYVKNKFDGSSLGNRIIGIGPVIMENGVDSSGLLSLNSLFNSIKNIRPDLKLTANDKFEKNVISVFNKDRLKNFYNNLFHGDFINLQNDHEIWDVMKTDFFMSLRLKDAMRLKKLDGTVKKKLQLEAELWDCKRYEVVWRGLIKGTGLNDNLSDRYFIKDAVLKAYNALPMVSPFYESGSW